MNNRPSCVSLPVCPCPSSLCRLTQVDMHFYCSITDQCCNWLFREAAVNCVCVCEVVETVVLVFQEQNQTGGRLEEFCSFWNCNHNKQEIAVDCVYKNIDCSVSPVSECIFHVLFFFLNCLPWSYPCCNYVLLSLFCHFFSLLFNCIIFGLKVVPLSSGEVFIK